MQNSCKNTHSLALPGQKGISSKHCGELWYPTDHLENRAPGPELEEIYIHWLEAMELVLEDQTPSIVEQDMKNIPGEENKRDGRELCGAFKGKNGDSFWK